MCYTKHFCDSMVSFFAFSVHTFLSFVYGFLLLNRPHDPRRNRKNFVVKFDALVARATANDQTLSSPIWDMKIKRS